MSASKGDKREARITWMFAGFVFALLIALGAASILSAYLMLFDTPVPAKFNNLPFPVEHQIIAPGEQQTMFAQMCSYTNGRTKNDIFFVNDVQLRFPEFTRENPLEITGIKMISENCGELRFRLKVPSIATPGEHYFRGEVIYQVNPLATRTVEWSSDSFWVTGQR